MSFIFFDRTVCVERLDNSFYRYCLRSQPGLIKYLFSRLLYGILNLFGLVSEEKYQNKRWRFLKDVKAQEKRAEKYWSRRRPKVYAIYEGERNMWISSWPEPLLRSLAVKHGALLTAQEYDLVDGKFGHFESAQELYKRALKSARPTRAVDAPKELVPTGVPTVHVYRGRAYATPGRCKAAQILFGAYTFLGLLALGVGLGLLSMYFGASFYLLDMFVSYFSVPLIPILNILPVVALVFLLYFVFNRVWLSFSVSAVITLVLSLINYYKLALRNDPFMASDISLATEAGGILSRYNVELNWKVLLAAGICVVAAIAAAFALSGRVRSPRVRSVGLLAVVCVSVFCYFSIYTSDKVYNRTANYGIVSQWSATGNYVCRGFVYPFLHSIKSAKVDPPENYDETQTIKDFSRYVTEDIPENDKVNVVMIMLEAFSDFSELDCLDMVEDVYGDLHVLEGNSVSGNLVTDIFAGGTVQTEWAVMTGNSLNDNYRSDVSSYVRYFNNQGYYTEGAHPCYEWFYNRLNVNRYMGFDNYYFCENRYNELYGGITYDDDFFSDLRTLYEQHVESSDQPYFQFSVTYQNHGPYEESVNYYKKSYVTQGAMSDESVNVINNYLGGIENTCKNVVEMAEYFDSRSEPVVFIVFGDHKPWMGNNNSVYTAMGANMNLDKDEGFFNYYSTPYIIHANAAAEKALNRTMSGEGDTISPCFLMNEFFNWAGWGGTAYMKVAGELMKVCPVINVTGRYLVDGELVTALPEELETKYRLFEDVQYYRRWNFADYR